MSWLHISDSDFTGLCNRFAANKVAMKIAEKAAKQADTARRRTEVQEKFAAMTEPEQEAWRLARQAKRQSRKSETEQKRSRLQQVNSTKHPHLADHIGALQAIGTSMHALQIHPFMTSRRGLSIFEIQTVHVGYWL